MLREILRPIRGKWAQLRRRQVFEGINRKKLWAVQESVSGVGSSLSATGTVRAELPKLLRQLQVRTLLDVPCGDFYWMSRLDLPVESYIGVDIDRQLIARNQAAFASAKRRFLALDAVREALPQADLILCRHLLIHLCFADCSRVLRNFQSNGARWLLVTHQPAISTNLEKPTGSFSPVNLSIAPFEFPTPKQIISDATTPEDTAVLALYRLSDLPL